jgi:TIR domain
MPRSAPLEVFYSYAHEDECLRDELEKHLKLLQRQNLISNWHDRRIEPGSEWASEIDSHVKSADIILLLVSADFMSSDYCYGVEMKEALERHRRHDAIVIPIILTPVLWDSAPFARIQALPRDGKPITSWPDRAEAFADIARGIRDVVLRYSTPPPFDATPKSASTLTRSAPEDRVLDAAISSHIVKDQSTELLTKIRLPGSPGLVGTLLADEEAEARPEDVRSSGFDVVFPIEPDGRPGDLRVEITLTSPDFLPDKQTKVMFVPPDDDSDTCYFLLTPVRIGQLRVLIELRWEEAVRGSRRLRTECVATADSIPAKSVMSVVQIKLGAGLETPDEVNTRPTSAPAAPTSKAPPKVLGPNYSDSKSSMDVVFGPVYSESREHVVPRPETKQGPARSRLMIPIALAIICTISTITVGYWHAHQDSSTSSPIAINRPPATQPSPPAATSISSRNQLPAVPVDKPASPPKGACEVDERNVEDILSRADSLMHDGQLSQAKANYLLVQGCASARGRAQTGLARVNQLIKYREESTRPASTGAGEVSTGPISTIDMRCTDGNLITFSLSAAELWLTLQSPTKSPTIRVNVDGHFFDLDPVGTEEKDGYRTYKSFVEMEDRNPSHAELEFYADVMPKWNKLSCARSPQ